MGKMWFADAKRGFMNRRYLPTATKNRAMKFVEPSTFADPDVAARGTLDQYRAVLGTCDCEPIGGGHSASPGASIHRQGGINFHRGGFFAGHETPKR
jgi:hypothetical protein